MERQELLELISDYCRAVGMAESTFGRQAVNDGKLVGRIRDGGRIGAATLGKIETFISAQAPAPLENRPVVAGQRAKPPTGTKPMTNFRFFDNRQKYLMFVNTCSEKWMIGERVAQELANIRPSPPSVRLFDAGIGDGTVLARLMRAMHWRFPTMPFYVVGKEISLEDIRLTLDKMPDRLFEHPSTVLVLTNLYYSESPWLSTTSQTAANKFVWKDVALRGGSAHEFQEQITELQPFLSDNWQAAIGASGNPIYERPVVLVLYREDHRFLLDPIIPRPGAVRADFDLVVASQPYRATATTAFKAEKVIGPLSRALNRGGRLIGIHSRGGDPGMEIIEKVWPDEDPFHDDRHAILKAVKKFLGSQSRQYNFNAGADSRAIFRYHMHTLPNEVTSAIGTSTLLAAWNAATYVAQIEDERLEQAILSGKYIAPTREVLQQHGGLWFNDESYIISRRRD
jgi:hypothetical protein